VIPIRKYKSDILLGLTLVELLFVLLFVTLIVTSAVKATEGTIQGVATSLEAENAKLEKQLKGKEATIKQLNSDLRAKRKENKDLEDQRQMLVGILKEHGIPITPEEPSKDSPDGSPGGVGKPLCDVYKGFLFSLTMNEDESFTIRCPWDVKENQGLMEIPVIEDIYHSFQGKNVGLQDFKGMCVKIFRYCEERDCRFKVEAYDNTETKSVYKELLNFLDSYYYVARR